MNAGQCASCGGYDSCKADCKIHLADARTARAVSGAMTEREVSLFLIGCSMGELLKACSDLRLQTSRTIPVLVGDVETLEAEVKKLVALVRRELNP